MSADPNPRILHFDGARNVRDLGGLPAADGRRLRDGHLFRADGLSRLSERDVATLARLGIRTIIDLRYDEERARAPDRVPAVSPPVFRHRGFLPQGSVELFAAINDHDADAATAFAIMRDNYARIPFEHAAELRAVMHDVLETAGVPCLIHCTSGKDRTGIAVALVLRALGVEAAVVMEDYLLSNGDYQAVDVFASSARRDAIDIVMAARAEYLQASLDAIDARCGSFDGYASELLHFGAAERLRLAEILLR